MVILILIGGKMNRMPIEIPVKKIFPTLLIALLLFSTASEIYPQSFVARWGSLPPGNSEFKIPFGIAVDISGKILVVDSGNNRVQVFNANGVYDSQWGSLGTGDGQFNFPMGIAVDTSGNIYVVDSGNSRIQKFNPDRSYHSQWGSLGNGNSQFNWPCGIAVDSAGNIYVADASNHRIQKFNSGGGYLYITS